MKPIYHTQVLKLWPDSSEAPSEALVQESARAFMLDYTHRDLAMVTIGYRYDKPFASSVLPSKNQNFCEADYMRDNYRFKVNKAGALVRVKPFTLTDAVPPKAVINSDFTKAGRIRFAVKPKPGFDWDRPLIERGSVEESEPRVLPITVTVEVHPDNYDWEFDRIEL